MYRYTSGILYTAFHAQWYQGTLARLTPHRALHARTTFTGLWHQQGEGEVSVFPHYDPGLRLPGQQKENVQNWKIGLAEWLEYKVPNNHSGQPRDVQNLEQVDSREIYTHPHACMHPPTPTSLTQIRLKQKKSADKKQILKRSTV